MQRRHFIASGIGMLAWAAGGGAIAGSRSGAGALSAAGFSAMLNDTFTLYDRVRGVNVQLVKVRKGPASPGTRQFTLSFAGASADALTSGTYEVEHPATGKLLMYLDASRRGQQGMLYRADFNLLV